MAPYLCDLAMLDHGYLRVARPWGVEVRVHWTVAAGALLAARLRFEPVLWLGFLAVVLAHQLGHSAAVTAVGGTLVGLDSTGLGGSCRWRGTGSLLERAWVAWGGVLAQAALLAATLTLSLLLGTFQSLIGTRLGYCFIEVNLAVLAINLLPFAPMDGALAWRLFGQLKASGWTLRQALLGWVWRWARRRRERRQDGPATGAGAAGALSAAPSPSTARDAGFSSPAPDSPYARAHNTGAPHSESYSQAGTDEGHEVDEEPLASPRPSAAAQREIDALLRRVEDKAARSKRGR